MSELRNGTPPIHADEILCEQFPLPLGFAANALAIAPGVPAPH